MKKKLPLRRFGVDDIQSPDLIGELSNRTPISRTSNHITLVCPICGVSFMRKASEAKRNVVNYCGKACAGFACRRQVEVECRACKKTFFVKRSNFGRVTCCSEKCRKKVISEITTKKDFAGWQTGMFKVGEKAPGAKLTETQAVSILTDTRANAAIALDYGVTRAAISQLKRGKTWRHLSDNEK